MSDTINQDKNKPIGNVLFPDGSKEDIMAYFNVYRDEREACVLRTEKGNVIVQTKSWLRDNNHELVSTHYVLTKDTFVMLFDAMLLGAEYLGIDLNVERDENIRFEYGGNGVPNFAKESGSKE